jgi:F-type H+-transporting ATPase subunit epsilon
MADGTILLEIVTPTGAALKQEVDELTAPSIAGEFGVLPGHVPILAAVKPGIISWKRKGEGGDGQCAVGWGFIEVSHDHAYVLTDRYAAKGKVDPVVVRAELKDVDAKLDKFTGPPESPEYHSLVEQELWCAAQLELHGDPPPATVAFISPYGPQPEQTDEGPDPSADVPTLDEPGAKH